MPTIYEKTAGALIPSSERSVTTYDSGLVRVDQVYTCATDHADTHRITLAIGESMPDGNSVPAIDGLYIYPTPQETKRQDGFTDFVVSAYGRTASTVRTYIPKVVTRNFGTFYYSTYEIEGTITVKRGVKTAYVDLGLPYTYSEPFGFIPVLLGDEITSVQDSPFGPWTVNFVNWDGNVILRTTRQHIITTTLSTDGSTDTDYLNLSDPVIELVNSRNFGDFTEIDFKTTQITANGNPTVG